MPLRPAKCLCLLFLLLAFSGTVSAAVDYVEGEVLVVFKPGLGVDGAAKALSRHSLKLERRSTGAVTRGTASPAWCVTGNSAAPACSPC